MVGHQKGPTQGQQLGSLASAMFGLIYVVVNAGPLPAGAGVALRVLGVVAFLGIAVASYRRRHLGAPVPSRGVGRGFGLVVAAEVVALLGGLGVLSGPLDSPQAGVAWVSFVVGVHFFALAVVLRETFFHWLGASITVCGAAGLALAVADVAGAPVAAISGVLPGGLLLASGWWGVHRTTGYSGGSADTPGPGDTPPPADHAAGMPS